MLTVHVCLCVCEQDNLKSLSFGSDPDHNPDPGYGLIPISGSRCWICVSIDKRLRMNSFLNKKMKKYIYIDWMLEKIRVTIRNLITRSPCWGYSALVGGMHALYRLPSILITAVHELYRQASSFMSLCIIPSMVVLWSVAINLFCCCIIAAHVTAIQKKSAKVF